MSHEISKVFGSGAAKSNTGDSAGAENMSTVPNVIKKRTLKAV